MSISEVDLFQRLVTLESDKLTLGADIKQLKEDSKYCEDNNPKGISKENIALIHAAAKLEAKQQFEEFSGKNAAVIDKYKELTNYDE